jgi:hypothetical protein
MNEHFDKKRPRDESRDEMHRGGNRITIGEYRRTTQPMESKVASDAVDDAWTKLSIASRAPS